MKNVLWNKFQFRAMYVWTKASCFAKSYVKKASQSDGHTHYFVGGALSKLSPV